MEYPISIWSTVWGSSIGIAKQDLSLHITELNTYKAHCLPLNTSLKQQSAWWICPLIFNLAFDMMKLLKPFLAKRRFHWTRQLPLTTGEFTKTSLARQRARPKLEFRNGWHTRAQIQHVAIKFKVWMCRLKRTRRICTITGILVCYVLSQFLTHFRFRVVFVGNIPSSLACKYCITLSNICVHDTAWK